MIPYLYLNLLWKPFHREKILSPVSAGTHRNHMRAGGMATGSWQKNSSIPCQNPETALSNCSAAGNPAAVRTPRNITVIINGSERTVARGPSQAKPPYMLVMRGARAVVTVIPAMSGEMIIPAFPLKFFPRRISESTAPYDIQAPRSVRVPGMIRIDIARDSHHSERMSSFPPLRLIQRRAQTDIIPALTVEALAPDMTTKKTMPQAARTYETDLFPKSKPFISNMKAAAAAA